MAHDITHHSIWADYIRLRTASPLVHNITNYVAMQTTANALLALGASPVMAHAPEEVTEITLLSSALVLNIGTLSSAWVAGMEKALTAALNKKIPIVIDPVGAGASTLRTQTALLLISQAKGCLVRGNASEILALASTLSPECTGKATKGVDSTASTDQAIDAAIQVAKKYNCTVCASGAIDFVTNGTNGMFIHGGHSIMPKITGMGCTASAFAGAFAAVCKNPFQALVASMVIMSAAGAQAAQQSLGPGTFAPVFMDTLYTMQEPMLSTVTLTTTGQDS